MDALAFTPGPGGELSVGQTLLAVVMVHATSDRGARCSQKNVWHAVAERRTACAGSPPVLFVRSLGELDAPIGVFSSSFQR